MTGTRIRRAGFSLVELMVVIAIIIVLVALVLAVSTSLVAQSEERETRNTLGLLEAAVQEWELAAGKPITYGTNQNIPGVGNFTFDIPATTADNNLIVELLFRMRGNDSVDTILSRINPEFLRRVGGNNPQNNQEVVDAWGNRIRVVFPGRGHVTPFDPIESRDDDGTIRLPLENRLGVARNRTILFVSAGPDGQFGDLSGSDAQRALARDNVYSYEPIEP